jgi:methylenetetrahydrofolate reductase (NADPH)
MLDAPRSLPKHAAPLASASALERRLRRGEFACVMEVYPPTTADLGPWLDAQEPLRPWCDTIQLTDMPLATPHVANLAAGAGLAARGFDVLLNVTCRDRNAIAQQGYLLGAAAMGVTGVFCLTGDHPRIGDHPDAAPVFEMTGTEWIALARRMRDEGVLRNGRAIEAPPRVLIGAPAAPDAPPVEDRPLDALRKVEAGAEVLITQPVLDLATFEGYMARLRALGVTDRAFVIAGVMAVTSPAQFLALRETPDVNAPDALFDALRALPEDQCAAAGLARAAETVARLREIPGVDGALIYPFGMTQADMIDLARRSGLARGA